MEQKKPGAEAGTTPVFALKWLANACDAVQSEENKKRKSVEFKAGTDGGFAGLVAPSRQKKDLQDGSKTVQESKPLHIRNRTGPESEKIESFGIESG